MTDDAWLLSKGASRPQGPECEVVMPVVILWHMVDRGLPEAFVNFDVDLTSRRQRSRDKFPWVA